MLRWVSFSLRALRQRAKMPGLFEKKSKNLAPRHSRIPMNLMTPLVVMRALSVSISKWTSLSTAYPVKVESWRGKFAKMVNSVPGRRRCTCCAGRARMRVRRALSSGRWPPGLGCAVLGPACQWEYSRMPFS